MAHPLVDFLASNGLTIRAEFVPFSQSRNAKPNAKPSERSLNWRVTIVHNGRDIMTADYMAGLAHAPIYKAIQAGQFGRGWTLDATSAIEFETEKGRALSMAGSVAIRGAKILPNAADVVACLVLDASALDCGSFEEWADEFGYESDSRKAAGMYADCLSTALKLRAGLGEDLFSKLREAAQDF